MLHVGNLHVLAAVFAAMAVVVDSSLLRGPVAAGNASGMPPQRARLDLGFAKFEQNVTSQVELAIQHGLGGEAWTEERRKRLIDNITASLKHGLEDALRPLKLTIGKTWVALPEDKQKAQYVDALRSSFATALERAKDTVSNHISIGVRRATTLSAESPEPVGRSASDLESPLLHKAEKAMLAGLLDEHCYGDLPVHQKAATKVAAALLQLGASNSTAAAANASKSFCIPSAVESLARRLTDNAGLVGMSARFEANAMELSQRSKAGEHI